MNVSLFFILLESHNILLSEEILELQAKFDFEAVFYNSFCTFGFVRIFNNRLQETVSKASVEVEVDGLIILL